jgi:hypothetical protein
MEEDDYYFIIHVTQKSSILPFFHEFWGGVIEREDILGYFYEMNLVKVN